MKFEGTIEGDALKGTMKSDMGDATVEGKRMGGSSAAAPAEEAPLTGPVELVGGTWKLAIQSPDGAANEGIMVCSVVNGKTTATLTTELGDIRIAEIALDGNKASFKTDVDFGGTLVPVSFVGSTGGDKIKGIVSLNFQGQEMALPVDGTKTKGLSGPIKLAGYWTLDVQTPDGASTESHIHVLAGDGGKFSGLLTTELGEAKLDSIAVNGNGVSFSTNIDFGGVPVPLAFQGTSGGDDIEGIVKVTFEGQEMELQLKGKRTGDAPPAPAAAPAAEEKPVASGCCTKPNCGPGCKGTAACGPCCKAA